MAKKTEPLPKNFRCTYPGCVSRFETRKGLNIHRTLRKHSKAKGSASTSKS